MAAPELVPWINSAGEGGDRNSMQEFPGDGSQTSFDFSFAGGYIFASNVKAYLYNISTGLTAVVSPIVLTGPSTIEVEPAPTADQILVVYRDTQKTVPLVDYSTGAVFSEANLDMSNKQAIFVAAEMVDRFDSINASSADAVERSVEALNTANEALAASDVASDAAVAAAASASAAAASASTAVTTANNALDVANGIAGTAEAAFEAAEDAVETSALAAAQAASAVITANGVDSKAQTALDNSAAAVTTANAASAVVATAVLKSGSTMTGPLTLSGDPSSALVAAPKQYVDSIVGLPQIIGQNFATTGASTMSGTFRWARMRDASGNYRIASGVGSMNLTLNNIQTGPAAGGRDQAGNFSASWLYVYVIYNPTSATYALLASSNSTTPTLPTGYTFYVFAFPVRAPVAANTVITTAVRGDEVWYPAASTPQLFNGNMSGSEQDISTLLQTYVPSIATMFRLDGTTRHVRDGSGNVDIDTNIRTVSGTNAATWQCRDLAGAPSTSYYLNNSCYLANTQSLYIMGSGTGAAANVLLLVTSFRFIC